ncbi:MAG: hypothetical protein R3190_11460 [Thermoanaerobaculia bacterium]|nr:hypothetical protein [Thermoanaerobaculia bacterium]
MATGGSAGDKPIKSAYELALERMESEGIERPRDEAFSDATLDAMGEVRSRAEAKIAELEILHQKQLAQTVDPLAAEELERNYRAERERIEDQRDRRIAELRAGESS